MIILPCQDSSPSLCTDWNRSKTMSTPNPLICNPVQSWRFIYATSITTHHMSSVIITHYKYNIRSLLTQCKSPLYFIIVSLIFVGSVQSLDNDQKDTQLDTFLY